MTETTVDRDTPRDVPERDSLALVTLIWRGMVRDFRIPWLGFERDREGHAILAVEAPHELVSQYLVTAKWQKWLDVLDRVSDLEMAMLAQIANYNREEVKERHGAIGLIYGTLLTLVLGIAERAGWLGWVEPMHILLAVSVAMALVTASLFVRLKAGELERCVKLAEVRRSARGGPAGGLDVAALVTGLPRRHISASRVLAWTVALILLSALVGGLVAMLTV